MYRNHIKIYNIKEVDISLFSSRYLKELMIDDFTLEIKFCLQSYYIAY